MSGVGEDDDIRAGCGAQGRQRAGWLGGQHVRHPRGLRCFRPPAAAAQPGDGEPVPGRCPVATLGIEQQCIMFVQVSGHFGDGARRLPRRTLARRDEAPADPADQHVEGGIEAQLGLQDDPGTPLVAREQQVDQHEGGSWPRMPGEDKQRAGGCHEVDVVRVGERLLDLEPEAEHEAGDRDEGGEETAQQRQVPAQLPLGVQAGPEARPDPQHQAREQARRLPEEVDDRKSPDPRQPPPHPPASHRDHHQRADGLADRHDRQQHQRHQREYRHQRRDQQPSHDPRRYRQRLHPPGSESLAASLRPRTSR